MVRLLALLVTFVKWVYALLGAPGILGLVAVIGGVLWALYRYGDHLFTWLLFRGLAAQGKVLRGAEVTVHSITPAPEPEKDAEDLEFDRAVEAAGAVDGPEYRYFYLEVTITPRPGKSDAQSEPWHPSMLMLTEAGRKNVELMEVDGAGFVSDGWVLRGLKRVPYEDQECHGPARLVLHITIRADCGRLQFLYMQEVFGAIAIPATVPSPAPSM